MAVRARNPTALFECMRWSYKRALPCIWVWPAAWWAPCMALGFAVGSSSVAVAGAEPTTGQNIKAYEQCLRRVEYPSLDLAPPLATSRRTEDAAENGGGLGHLRLERRCPALAQARPPS